MGSTIKTINGLSYLSKLNRNSTIFLFARPLALKKTINLHCNVLDGTTLAIILDLPVDQE